MLNICFKYACAREKTAFLVKNKCIFSVLEIRFSFFLLGVARKGLHFILNARGDVLIAS